MPTTLRNSIWLKPLARPVASHPTGVGHERIWHFLPICHRWSPLCVRRMHARTAGYCNIITQGALLVDGVMTWPLHQPCNLPPWYPWTRGSQWYHGPGDSDPCSTPFMTSAMSEQQLPILHGRHRDGLGLHNLCSF